jgi:hypothetical protein
VLYHKSVECRLYACPNSLDVCFVTSQQLHQCPIYYLSLPISLRMKGNGVLQHGIHSFPKHCPKYSQGHVVPIRYDGGWQFEVYLDMNKEYFTYFSSRDCLLIGNEKTHFVEAVYHN